MEIVADAVSRLVDACSWWISRTDESGEMLHTVNYSAIRFGGGFMPDPEAVGGGASTFALADYPVTRAMLEGRATTIVASDADADPRERAILDAAGFTGVVMAGGRDRSGRGWLVEIFVDDISADVSALPGSLRALTACALVLSPDR
jgi:hypothetical protein